MYEYDSNFYQYINTGSRKSAQRILPLLLQHLDVKSVVDFGCGQGAWVQVWEELGIETVIGLDGEYVDTKNLLFNIANFIPTNLTKAVSLGRKFDIVQSLEVAEHIPERNARQFVQNLTDHGSIILFSAATPGQGGENHINEKPYEYWRDIFYEKGYFLLDYLRPRIQEDKDIEPWYRYNTFLFIDSDILKQLPEELRQSLREKNTSIPDVSPILYKCRKAVLRALPSPLISIGAGVKKRFHNLARKFSTKSSKR